MTSARRLNYYGHFKRGATAKRNALARKVERAHAEALREEAQRAYCDHNADVMVCGGGETCDCKCHV